MPVKMQPVSVIKANLGIEPNGRVQKFFTNECAKEMLDYKFLECYYVFGLYYFIV